MHVWVSSKLIFGLTSSLSHMQTKGNLLNRAWQVLYFTIVSLYNEIGQ